jgi:hypothetical protein
MKEQNILKLIQLAASSHGCVLHRNNVGAYKHPAEGYMIRYGVGGPGGSDLIGWTSDGIFIAIEVKTKTGKASQKQLNFIEQVKKSGGKAGIARSVDDALKIIKG